MIDTGLFDVISNKIKNINTLFFGHDHDNVIINKKL
jgi:hypothetical protein